MIDYTGFMVQGLFVGIGAAGTEWIKEKYIKPYLDKVHKITRNGEKENKTKTEMKT